jgi:uncharacterized protein
MTEDSTRPSLGDEEVSLEHPRIDRLFIYPVKSCRGILLADSIVLDEGLEHDRRWMIVDPHGVFLTQRECPAMARIVPSLPLNAAGLTELHLQLANAQGLVDQASPEVRVEPSHENALRKVLVWKFEGQAVDCGHQAAKFLSDFLQRPVRLVRFSPSETRICNKAWTGELTGRTYFSDGYPILVMSQASVADLANRMNQKNLVMERFRPNIVISGLPAYEEDFIQSLRLIHTPDLLGSEFLAAASSSPLALRLVKPCPRCPIPKVDPWTGSVALFDPAAELATYRYHQAAEGAVLGMNSMAYQGQGQRIAVGQRFEAIYDF